MFTGVQFAGEVIDTQIGFAPEYHQPDHPAERRDHRRVPAGPSDLIYLIADAHHQMIAGIAGSFNLVPLPFVAIQPTLAADLVGFFSNTLLLVFQIAGPVALALFVVNVALALMTRVAPQVNIFAVGFPLQIVIGLIILLVSLPLLVTVLPGVFDQTPRELDTALRRLVPPT